MKKLIYLFLTLFTAITYGQADFPEGIQISAGQPTVTSVNFLTTTDNTLSGLQGKIAPINLPIPYTPVNYSISNQSIGQHLTGIDTRLGQISSTTAGITQRVYFTADNTTVNAVTYFASSLTGKGSTATGSPPALVLADNTKAFFTKDLISIAQPSNTIGYAGTYSGQLTVSASPAPAQQRFTVEIYKTNNLGVPIASGVSGAPTGDLGVTVIAILDSGLINLTAGAITNIQVSGILTQNITINTGERLRYHVSAAKVGTGGGNVTFGVYYGSSYNSYYDVPVAIRTNAVLNDAPGLGITATDALNSLNTLKEDLTNKQNSLTTDVSNTKYPTVTAVNTGLAAKQNNLTNPITGTGTRTANYMPVFSGTNTISNGRIYDSGVGMSFGGSTVFGGYEFLIPAIGNNSIYLGVADGVKNPRAYISHQTTSSTQNVVFGSAFSSGSTMADWIFESGNVRINNLAGTGTRNVAADANGNLVIANVDSRPYKVYTAIISQSGTSAPSVIEQENTTGAIVTWTRTSTGQYTGTFSSAVLTSNKTIVSPVQCTPPYTNFASTQRSSTTQVSIVTTAIGANTDGLLTTANSYIEVRVYP